MCQLDQFLQPIQPLRSDEHIRGSATAKVILVEYGDFQCPRSGQLYLKLKELTQQLQQNLGFVFRHFPKTDLNSRAQIAAETAEAAHAQGKFWEMHDLLFEHQTALEDADLLEYAIALNLNIPQFLQELADHVYSDRIQGDINSAQTYGISKAPAIFILVQPTSDTNLAEILMKLLEIVT
ncbi:MAG: hypothetical protein Kow00121_40350 [Elainellaceae cyanobacterium]